jgi:hypothetical protein
MAHRACSGAEGAIAGLTACLWKLATNLTPVLQITIHNLRCVVRGPLEQRLDLTKYSDYAWQYAATILTYGDLYGFYRYLTQYHMASKGEMALYSLMTESKATRSTAVFRH